MDDDLKNKIIQMDAQSLNKIIQNPELYNENVVSFAKYCANIRLNPSNEENYKISKNGLFTAYAKMFKNYANFKGRSSRSDFWYVALMNLVITILLYIIFIPSLFVLICKSFEAPPQTIFLIVGGVFYIVWCFATLIPSLALSIRRLHDIGKSGWWCLIVCIPIAGIIIWLVYMTIKGNDNANIYGENPVYSAEKISAKGVKTGFVALCTLAFLSIIAIFFTAFTNTASWNGFSDFSDITLMDEKTQMQSVYLSYDVEDKNEDISVEKTTSTLSIPKVSDFKYVKITDGDGETYRITWDSVKGAVGYEVEDIQYDTGSEAGPYKQINETSECKYEVGASIGVTAKIRVRAYGIDTSGIRLYSNWSEQKTVNICGGYIAEDLSDASLGEGIKYRVRNRYHDEASQIGAFEDFNNAVKTANQNPGYCVFDMNGNILYDSSQSE